MRCGDAYVTLPAVSTQYYVRKRSTVGAVEETVAFTFHIRDEMYVSSHQPSRSFLFHLLTMTQLLLHELSDDLHRLLFCQWLDVRSLVTLDVAVSSSTSRPYWMRLLGSLRFPSIDNMHHSPSSLRWLIQRGICTSRIQMKVNAWKVPGCDLTLLKTNDLAHLGLKGCRNVTDECILKAVQGSNRVGDCRRFEVGDHVVSALSAGCGQLQSIIVALCDKVTAAGISALGNGGGQLRSIDVRGCRKVTGAGISALSAGCGQLQSINLADCDKVTDAGISALSAVCGQLRSINLRKCHKVTDGGVKALGAGCGQLQSIDLSGCDKLTYAGVSAATWVLHVGDLPCILR